MCLITNWCNGLNVMMTENDLSLFSQLKPQLNVKNVKIFLELTLQPSTSSSCGSAIVLSASQISLCVCGALLHCKTTPTVFSSMKEYFLSPHVEQNKQNKLNNIWHFSPSSPTYLNLFLFGQLSCLTGCLKLYETCLSTFLLWICQYSLLTLVFYLNKKKHAVKVDFLWSQKQNNDESFLRKQITKE